MMVPNDAWQSIKEKVAILDEASSVRVVLLAMCSSFHIIA
jgi:hypothetical protein